MAIQFEWAGPSSLQAVRDDPEAYWSAARRRARKEAQESLDRELERRRNGRVPRAEPAERADEDTEASVD